MIEDRAFSGFRDGAGGVFTCGWSVRAAGNMSFTSGETSQSGSNRRQFLAGLGIACTQLVMPHQVHGARIELVDRKYAGRGAETADSAVADTDALLTRERGIAIGVMTADCLPVFIIDPLVPAVAMVHAGWRSTRECIAVKAVGRMCAEFGAQLQSMRCLLGPCIRPCCYEVGGEMKEVFPHSVSVIAGRPRLDIAAENRRQLNRAGIPARNIFDTGRCTHCSGSEFFSYRREGITCGRMMSVIMLL